MRNWIIGGLAICAIGGGGLMFYGHQPASHTSSAPGLASSHQTPVVVVKQGSDIWEREEAQSKKDWGDLEDAYKAKGAE